MVMSARTKMTVMVFMAELSPAIEAKSARHFGEKQKLPAVTTGTGTLLERWPTMILIIAAAAAIATHLGSLAAFVLQKLKSRCSSRIQRLNYVRSATRKTPTVETSS
jgi:hypothetical protein